MPKTNLGPVALKPKGEYSNTAAYTRLDVVTYRGSSYVALQSLTGTEPVENTTNANWQCIARKGDVGNPGQKGDTGPVGPSGADGKAATVQVGTVTTGTAGSQAEITNVGTDKDAIFDFKIPQGIKGADGTMTFEDLTPEQKESLKGDTPYIGENGNWWIGTTDTGYSADINGKVDKQQETSDAGKLLGIGEDGIIAPMQPTNGDVITDGTWNISKKSRFVGETANTTASTYYKLFDVNLKNSGNMSILFFFSGYGSTVRGSTNAGIVQLLAYVSKSSITNAYIDSLAPTVIEDPLIFMTKPANGKLSVYFEQPRGGGQKIMYSIISAREVGNVISSVDCYEGAEGKEVAVPSDYVFRYKIGQVFDQIKRAWKKNNLGQFAVCNLSDYTVSEEATYHNAYSRLYSISMTITVSSAPTQELMLRLSTPIYGDAAYGQRRYIFCEDGTVRFGVQKVNDTAEPGLATYNFGILDAGKKYYVIESSGVYGYVQ